MNVLSILSGFSSLYISAGSHLIIIPVSENHLYTIYIGGYLVRSVLTRPGLLQKASVLSTGRPSHQAKTEEKD